MRIRRNVVLLADELHKQQRNLRSYWAMKLKLIEQTISKEEDNLILIFLWSSIDWERCQCLTAGLKKSIRIFRRPWYHRNFDEPFSLSVDVLFFVGIIFVGFAYDNIWCIKSLRRKFPKHSLTNIRCPITTPQLSPDDDCNWPKQLWPGLSGSSKVSAILHRHTCAGGHWKQIIFQPTIRLHKRNKTLRL